MDYRLTDEEIAILDKYEGIFKQKSDPYRYDTFDKESLASFCLIKDKNNDLFTRRYTAARDVIDTIARAVGIDPDKSGYDLYHPDPDGSTPIVSRLEEWMSKSGEKAQLKKRVQELEQENAVLRSLIQK